MADKYITARGSIGLSAHRNDERVRRQRYSGSS